MEIVLTPHVKLDQKLVPTKVMVLGSEYKVNFGPQVRPQFHIVNKQRQCCCGLGRGCPAVDAVAEYLPNGGQRALDLMPPYPICGAPTIRDSIWDGRFTRGLGI